MGSYIVLQGEGWGAALSERGSTAERPPSLARFFTAQRLRYYRDQARSLPLWRGAWPEDLIGYEAFSWGLRRRLEDEGLASGPSVNGAPVVRFAGDLEAETLPLPILPRARDMVVDKTPRLALLAAINYCHRIATDVAVPTWDAKDVAAVWASRLHAHLSDRHGEESIGIRIRRIVLGEEKDEAARALIMSELRDEWLRLGERIGLLPSVQGGTRCFLPDPFLAQWLGEAVSIAQSVAEYVIDSNEYEALAALFGSAEEVLNPLQVERISSAVRTGGAAEAKALEAEMVAQALKSLPVEEWGYRIRFPLLNAEEIRGVRADLGAGRSERRILTAAGTLLAGRLPISRDTIFKRTKAFRP